MRSSEIITTHPEKPRLKVVRSIKDSDTSHCSFDHDWSFSGNGSRGKYDVELKQAIRHMVSTKHTIAYQNYGGLPLDENLPGRLSISWFKRVGLLKPLALRFKGDINQALEFAFPEGLKTIDEADVSSPTYIRDKRRGKLSEDLPPVNSTEFWRELKADLESLDGAGMTMRRFITSWHPTKNPNAWSYAQGKYKHLRYLYGNNQSGQLEIAPGIDLLTEGFKPPANQPEFVTLVREARELIEEKLELPRSKEDVEKKLQDKEFWKEFEKNIEGFSEESSFLQFLQAYVSPEYTVKGLTRRDAKYRDIAYYLRSTVNADEFLDIGQTDPEELRKSIKDKRNKTILDAAPQSAKIVLIAKFPQDFGTYAEQELTEQGILTEEIKSIVELSSLLGLDGQSAILNALSDYIYIKQLKQSDKPLSITTISAVWKTIENELPKKKIKKISNFTDVIESSRFMERILDDLSNEKDKELSEASNGLLTALKDFYYLPLFKSLLYKPAALYWSERRSKSPSQEIHSLDLIKFLQNYVQHTTSKFTEEQNSQFGFFKEKILSDVYRQFVQVVMFAREINYFKIEEDDSKHLLFHQIEGIKRLMEWECGIVSDEPGTGKTVILSLAALNLLDKKEKPQDRSQRVLVVGGKAVIDNWEGELEIHINTDNTQVLNVNFSREGRANQSVARRLKRLGTDLDSRQNAKQVVLINYDMFRNPIFKRMLADYKFDAVIVDEAHNIKSRYFESIMSEIEDTSSKRKSKVAQRTEGLYKFIKDHPELPVFFATSTPFVKDLVEPLIMAHLVNQKVVTPDAVWRLKDDSVGTYKILRQIMIRRKKDEIADLPPKEISHIPIDLTSLSETEKQEFIRLAERVRIKTGGEKFAYFYSMLALEGQAKFPWLVEKVKELITQQGKKVVIFTPFVAAENRYTAPISTINIAKRLASEGIDSVGILDGTLNDYERQQVQKSFRSAGGIRVLVGNYVTAGESITLNSPVNHATEAILFVSPNVISRHIQSIDRIHRIGQMEDVTIHIPFLTGDLLDRDKGTYDERLVGKIAEEMAVFDAVIDGLFFLEPKDLYQSIAQQEAVRIRGATFTIFHAEKKGVPLDGSSMTSSSVFNTEMHGVEKTPFKIDRRRKNNRPSENDNENELPTEIEIFDRSINGKDGEFEGTLAERINIQDNGKTEDDYNTEDLVNAYITEMRKYPLLTYEQEQAVFGYMKRGEDILKLKEDTELMETFEEENRSKFAYAVSRSKSVRELIATSNLRLVMSVARGYRKRGLSFLDLVQEGNIGLMKAIEDFNPERETEEGSERNVKFSTYATHWIKQTIRRALDEKGSIIRAPVHMRQSYYKAVKAIREFEAANGRTPNASELKEQLLQRDDMDETDVKNVINYIQSSVLNVGSLDAQVGNDDSSFMFDLIPDPKQNTEETAIEHTSISETKTTITNALGKLLTERERMVIEMRYGLKNGRSMTLEQVGRGMNLTRERIRQLESMALIKLRKNPQLFRYFLSS